MALKDCQECGKQFSTSASACPHCGAKQTSLAAKCLLGVAGFIGMLVFVGNFLPHDSTPAGNGPSPTPESSPITDCSVKAMQSIPHESHLSWEQMAGACTSLQRSVHYTLTRESLQTFFTAIVAFKYLGYADDPAYHLANFIEARTTTQEDPKALHPALDAAFKIYETTEQRVTPKELVVLLRSGGESTRKLSDDGLYPLAFMMWESMKDNGE